MAIVIVIEGGIVQHVATDGEVDNFVYVIDYDIDGAEEKELTDIETSNRVEAAYVSEHHIDAGFTFQIEKDEDSKHRFFKSIVICAEAEVPYDEDDEHEENHV